MLGRLQRRLADGFKRVRRRPIVCRRCGATLGQARPIVRNGRLLLRDFDAIVRVRWTEDDQLAFEHVRDSDCRR